MKATKGQTVYYAIGNWSNLSGCVRKMTVHSWGKKVAKFHDSVTGEMIREQFYPQDGDHPQMYATRAEALTAAMANAKSREEYGLKEVRSTMAHYNDRRESYHYKSNAEKLAAYEERGLYVVDYNEWMTELYAKRAA